MIIRIFLLFFAGLSLALPACAEQQPQRLHGTVTWVYDGDTLEISEIGKVHLIGIDTPEHENSQRDWFLEKQGVPASRQRIIYRQAKQYNIRHVKGQRVSLTLDNPVRDKYGRLLAYVHLQDGRILNRVLLEQGLAVVYRKFSFNKKQDFIAAEGQARQAKRGLWQTAD